MTNNITKLSYTNAIPDHFALKITLPERITSPRKKYYSQLFK